MDVEHSGYEHDDNMGTALDFWNSPVRLGLDMAYASRIPLCTVEITLAAIPSLVALTGRPVAVSRASLGIHPGAAPDSRSFLGSHRAIVRH